MDKDINETVESEVNENTEVSESVENIESVEDIENVEKVEDVKKVKSVKKAESVENIESVENVGSVKTGRNLRKERIGIVASNKMDKTIVVKIEERVEHSKYSKIMKRSIKFKAHDENNECDIGDKVLIMETRPYSKDKHFRLVKILEKVK